MTKEQIYQTALQQSAIDLNCCIDDLLSDEYVIVSSKDHPLARKYLKLPFACNFVSYGNGIVASCNDELAEIADRYINGREWYRCFETPDIMELSQMVEPLGYGIKFMAEYFLPDPKLIPDISCKYETRQLSQHDFKELYLPEWSNALCAKRPHLDVMGVGAYDKGKLIGLAACSADCDTMYQIGIDVLPEYRRQGIASALTSALAERIIEAGKVPFYCAAWSNIRSVRNAVKSGFRPAWVELTVVKKD